MSWTSWLPFGTVFCASGSVGARKDACKNDGQHGRVLFWDRTPFRQQSYGKVGRRKISASFLKLFVIFRHFVKKNEYFQKMARTSKISIHEKRRNTKREDSKNGKAMTKNLNMTKNNKTMTKNSTKARMTKLKNISNISSMPKNCSKVAKSL